jgi:hypothetical protein
MADDTPIPDPKTIADLGRLYGIDISDEMDASHKWFVGMLGALWFHGHIKNAPDELKRGLYATMQDVVDFVRDCQDPGLWEPAAQRRDELDEAEMMDRDEELGFGILRDYKPHKKQSHIDVMYRVCARHYRVPAAAQREVAWLAQKYQRIQRPEGQDLALWWVQSYSLIVETIVVGVGFPPGKAPPAPDDELPDNVIQLHGRTGIIDGAHRNPRKPRSEAA